MFGWLGTCNEGGPGERRGRKEFVRASLRPQRKKKGLVRSQCSIIFEPIRNYQVLLMISAQCEPHVFTCLS